MTQGSSSLTVTTPSDEEVRMTRTFAASRNLVYDAWTKPDLLRRWLGREGDEMIVCDVDLRVGGSYRFVWRLRESGDEMGMGGVYREIVPNERIVCTEKFDAPYDDVMGEAVTTLTLEERDGKTTLTSTTRYPSRETRDSAMATGMADGAGESYDRLAALLAA